MLRSGGIPIDENSSHMIAFDENSNLIFKINPSDQINEMSKIVGYDIRMISPNFGNA